MDLGLRMEQAYQQMTIEKKEDKYNSNNAIVAKTPQIL